MSGKDRNIPQPAIIATAILRHSKLSRSRRWKLFRCRNMRNRFVLAIVVSLFLLLLPPLTLHTIRIASTATNYTIKKPKLLEINCNPRDLSDMARTSTTKSAYPPRQNMGSCSPLYGKVTVLVAFHRSSYNRFEIFSDPGKCCTLDCQWYEATRKPNEYCLLFLRADCMEVN